MKNTIIIVSKDILGKFLLPVYGNPYWSTPNIDELATKGTVFMNHYTTAPSTAMAFTAMFAGKFPHELKRKRYVHVEKYDENKTFFDLLEKDGYDCHVIWNKSYMTVAKPYAECFGNAYKTKFHLMDMSQPVGAHFPHRNPLVRDHDLAEKTLKAIEEEYESIKRTEKQMIWMHLPHVIKGRTGYGDDIDLLDRIIGFLRKRYGDESIYVTGDHGHMNLRKGKTGYGFDVYEPAIAIPFITPRIVDYEIVDEYTSNVDFMTIVLEERIVKREHIFSDTAYYAQPHRKLAIIKAGYKYIYNKEANTEELYDINRDANENMNLMNETILDIDRNKNVRISDVIYYPLWENIPQIISEMRQIKQSMWKNGTFIEELCFKVRRRFRKFIIIVNKQKRKEALKKQNTK